MLLGACGTQTASSEASEETTAVDTYYAQWPDADAALTAVTDGVLDGDHLLFISDGREIAEADMVGTLLSDWAVPLSEDQVLTCLDARGNGETALLRFNTQEERTELLVLNSDGELLSQDSLPLEGIPCKLLWDGTSGYYIACEQVLYHINASLEVNLELPISDFTQLMCYEDALLVFQVGYTASDTSQTVISKLENAALSTCQTLEGSFTGFTTPDGALCLSDSQGLSILDLDTGTLTSLCTWDSLGLEIAYQFPIAAFSLSDMLFSSSTLDATSVLWVTTTAPEPDEHTITLKLGYWALPWGDEMAIDSFNRSQNNYRIETVCYYPENGAGDVTAAIAQMNADLLTGEAPDLYAFNGIDVDALMDAGLLLDLNSLMDGDSTFSRSEYYENIWELFEVEGSLYEFIPRFQLAGLAGSRDILGTRTGWTVAEFSAFADRYADQVLVSHCTGAEFLYRCLRYGGQSMLDTSAYTCSLDTGELEALMTLCSRLPDTRQDSGLLQEFQFYWPSDYTQLSEEVGGPVTLVGYPSESACGPVVSAAYTFGISSSTQYAEGAWAFLKFLLRDNQQYIGAVDGFPIKRATLERLLSQAALPATDKNSLFYGSSTQPLSEDDAAYLQSLVETATQRYCRYEAIRDIVDEEAASYFSGDKTAAEVCKIAQNRAMIYLGEQH
jgi:ABC-type glycerol-3-phosphate transport system substrate-binding protein